jgi:hypothetical protein
MSLMHDLPAAKLPSFGMCRLASADCHTTSCAQPVAYGGRCTTAGRLLTSRGSECSIAAYANGIVGAASC